MSSRVQLLKAYRCCPNASKAIFPRSSRAPLFNLVQSTWVEAVKRRPRGRQANASDKQQENAIAGIAVCSECGSVMTRVVHGSRKTGRVSAHIVCSRAKNRRDCEYKTASLKRIEETLFQATAEWSVDHASSSYALDLRRQRDELLGQWKLELQIIGLHTRSSSKVERLLERQRETGSQLASVERQLAATGVTVHRTKIKEAMSAVNGMRVFLVATPQGRSSGTGECRTKDRVVQDRCAHRRQQHQKARPTRTALVGRGSFDPGSEVAL